MLLKVHLFAAIIYIASLFAMGVLAIPLLRRKAPEECMARVAGILRFYHPYALFLLGLLLMTGAFLLTDLKIAIGANFFTITYKSLSLKLLLVFLIIFFSSHQFFGVGLKLTRANAPLELREFTMPIEEQMKVLRRLQVGTFLNLALAAGAFYIGWTMR